MKFWFNLFKYMIILSWKIVWVLPNIADKVLPIKVTQSQGWRKAMQQGIEGKERIEKIFQ